MVWRRIFNGKRNGVAKAYYLNNALAFEGEYLDGKINGKGKEYYDNDNLRLEIIFIWEKKLKSKRIWL